jgi:hypothetical protein
LQSSTSGRRDILLSSKVDGLREELRLMVFENRVLSRIFGPKRDEVTGE